MKFLLIKCFKKLYRKYLDNRSPIEFEIDNLKRTIKKSEDRIFDLQEDFDWWYYEEISNKLERQRKRLKQLLEKLNK